MHPPLFFWRRSLSPRNGLFPVLGEILCSSSGVVLFFVSVFGFGFLTAKNFVSIWARAWERAPAWLKSCLVAAGSRSGTSPGPSGCQRGPSKAAGLQRLLVMLEGESLEEILAHPSLEVGQPVKMRQGVTHLLDEFHLLPRKWLSRKSRSWGSVRAEPRIHRSKRASSPEPGLFHGVQDFTPTHLGTASARPGEGAAATLVLHLQEGLSTLPYLPEPHLHGPNRKSEEGGVEDLPVHVDQVVGSSLHLRGVGLMNLGAHG